MRRALHLAAFAAGVFVLNVVARVFTDSDVVLLAVAFFGTLLLGLALRSLEARQDRAHHRGTPPTDDPR